MENFLERIEHHLRRVQRIEGADVIDADEWPDLARHDATVVALFEQIAAQGPRSENWARSQFPKWSRLRLEHFVDEAHWELLTGIGARLSATIRSDYIDAAINIAADHIENVSVPFSIRERLREIARTSLRVVDSCSGDFTWEMVSRYCERLGMVRERPAKPGMRLAGQTFLRLRGLDRLRWLLALEGVASSGEHDTWCLSPIAGTTIEEFTHVVWMDGEPSVDNQRFPNRSTVERWTKLGALQTWEHEDFGTSGHHLTDAGSELFGKSNQSALELFRTLAAAEADDLRNEALNRGSAVQSASAAAAELRYARLVAHEVRNALLPVRYELGKVWKTIERAGDGQLGDSRKKIEDGISRLYAFVETSARMTAPVDELPAPCLILDVLDEARRGLMPALSGSITIETIPGSANPSCIGHRGRLVLALTNLFRNAVQAGGPSVEIKITVDASDHGRTLVILEDNGPGIDDAVRHHLFENGVSTRADGTGHGLALVREVVEQDMRGTVSHEPNPGGGARFRLELPSPRGPR